MNKWLEELKLLDPKNPGAWPWPFRLAAFISLFFVILVALYFVVYQGQLENLEKEEKKESVKPHSAADKKIHLDADSVHSDQLDTPPPLPEKQSYFTEQKTSRKEKEEEKIQKSKKLLMSLNAFDSCNTVYYTPLKETQDEPRKSMAMSRMSTSSRMTNCDAHFTRYCLAFIFYFLLFNFYCLIFIV